MINPNATSLITANLMPRQAVGALQLQLAAGIMGQFFNPLNAGRLGFGFLPQLMALRCFTCVQPGAPFTPPPLPGCGICINPVMPQPEPVQQWTVQNNGGGRAAVDLGDGYSLKFNERSSEIEIFNAKTGEHTRIWGDPHVDVDGKRVFDFWGTTTFTLENGTKITINTEPWKGNANAYVASQVVVTKGSNALVVDGISQNQLGDLKVTMSNNGYAVDAAHRDGYVLHENATGSSWRSEHTGEVATQADLMATAVGREYGPGSQLSSMNEAFSQIGSFLLFGSLLGFNFAFAQSVDRAADRIADRIADRFVDRVFDNR
jgi:hypothetical protein